MRTVLAQLAPVPGELGANLRVAQAAIADAAGADLVVLPELYLQGYDLARVAELAVALDGPEVAELGQVAAEAQVAVVIGFAERLADGAIANSAVALERDGSIAGCYRKTHLFGSESEAFRAGDELVVVPLAGRSVGLLVCFDMEFPEVGRTLAAKGADVLVTISANADRFGPDHEVFARARALETGLPHVYVNRVGDESGETFVGGSAAIDPDGRTLVRAGPEPAALLVEVRPPVRADPRVRYSDLLRPELYSLR